MSPGRVKKLLLFFIALIILSAGIISFSSIFGITELVYPVKVDSAYVAALQMSSSKKADSINAFNPELFLFKPEQLDLNYQKFNVETFDSLMLTGWYFTPAHEETGISILIVHDINESKINYLEAAKAFTERGFRVCCVDMRACGESEGNYFTMGSVSTKDISTILDSLYCKSATHHVAVFGIGTGAAIAIQELAHDQRPMALVVQNCFTALTGYYSRYAKRKWGILGKWFFPLMKKELDRQMGFNSDSLNLQQLIVRVQKPSLFVAKAKESLEDLKETHSLFELSKAEKKDFIFFNETSGMDSAMEQQKEYYDKISAFISTAAFTKQKHTRFKKLVLNDHTVNN
jgi:predicted alpha/beta-fold hydrolase